MVSLAPVAETAAQFAFERGAAQLGRQLGQHVRPETVSVTAMLHHGRQHAASTSGAKLSGADRATARWYASAAGEHRATTGHHAVMARLPPICHALEHASGIGAAGQDDPNWLAESSCGAVLRRAAT